MVQKGQRKMRGNFRARELSSLDLQSSFFRFTYKKQDRNLRFTRRSDNEYFKIENRWKLKTWSKLKNRWKLKNWPKLKNWSKLKSWWELKKKWSNLKTIQNWKMKNWKKIEKNHQNLQNWPKLVKTKKIEKSSKLVKITYW